MLFFMIFTGCSVKQTGAITHISGVDNQCAYVAVKREKTEGGFIRPQTTKYLAVKDSVFLCCPDGNGKPICKKADFENLLEPNFYSSYTAGMKPK